MVLQSKSVDHVCKRTALVPVPLASLHLRGLWAVGAQTERRGDAGPSYPLSPSKGRGLGWGHGRRGFCCEAKRTGPKVFHDLSSISPIYAPKGFTKSGFFCASVQKKPIPCLRDSLFASSLGLGYSTEISDPARRPSAGAMPGRCGFCLRGETHRPSYVLVRATLALRFQRSR